MKPLQVTPIFEYNAFPNSACRTPDADARKPLIGCGWAPSQERLAGRALYKPSIAHLRPCILSHPSPLLIPAPTKFHYIFSFVSSWYLHTVLIFLHALRSHSLLQSVVFLLALALTLAPITAVSLSSCTILLQYSSVVNLSYYTLAFSSLLFPSMTLVPLCNGKDARFPSRCRLFVAVPP